MVSNIFGKWLQEFVYASGTPAHPLTHFHFTSPYRKWRCNHHHKYTVLYIWHCKIMDLGSHKTVNGESCMDTGAHTAQKHFMVLAVHNKMAEHHYCRPWRHLQFLSLKGHTCTCIFAVLVFNMYMLNYWMAREGSYRHQLQGRQNHAQQVAKQLFRAIASSSWHRNVMQIAHNYVYHIATYITAS